jgi:hypothetical protein
VKAKINRSHQAHQKPEKPMPPLSCFRRRSVALKIDAATKTLHKFMIDIFSSSEFSEERDARIALH